MSSNTTRVSLYKPAGGENVNVTTDLNNNLDKLDTNLNFRVAVNAAARNAITPFWAGLNVRDTDTGKLWVSNGSAPISGSWDQILTSGTYATAVNVNPAATGTVGVNMKAAAEANNRWQVRADGRMSWGAGSGAVDVNLYRANSTTLKTDTDFEAAGTVTAAGDIISTTGQLVIQNGGTSKKNSVPSASTTVTTSTTETVVAAYTIPAADMTVGAVYKLTVFGTINTVATPPNLTIRGRIGNGISGAQFAQTGAIVQNASNTTRVFKAEIYLVCLTTGASGTCFGNLDVWNGAATGTPGTTNPTNFQNTTAVSSSHIMDGGTTATVNTTISNSLSLTAQWASSNAAAVLVRGFAAERIA